MICLPFCFVFFLLFCLKEKETPSQNGHQSWKTFASFSAGGGRQEERRRRRRGPGGGQKVPRRRRRRRDALLRTDALLRLQVLSLLLLLFIWNTECTWATSADWWKITAAVTKGDADWSIRSTLPSKWPSKSIDSSRFIQITPFRKNDYRWHLHKR